MPDQPPVLLTDYTRREFRQALERGDLQACIIPVGSIEQHLEHLCFDHDSRSVMHVAVQAAKRLVPRCVVAAPMMIGISEHHMRHPGTLSAKPGSFLAVLYDAIESIARTGIRHILALNGHGGNSAPIQGVFSQFQQRLNNPPMGRGGPELASCPPVNLHWRSYWDLLPAETAGQHMTTPDLPGHAQEFETAFALAAFPERVRGDALRDQADPAMLAATAEAGRAMIEGIVEGVVECVEGMMSGQRTTEVPVFY